MIKEGSIVRLKKHTRRQWRCPEGRDNNNTATVRAVLSKWAADALFMNQDLHGCRYWRVEDLEEVL